MENITKQEFPTIEETIPTVYVDAINPKKPLHEVETLALKNAVIHKHPLNTFRETWNEIDSNKTASRNELHKYYNDVIRRVQKTGYTEEDLRKLGHDNYVSFFKGMAGYGKDESDQNNLWWKAINMSPENQGTWFRDKNIDYQKYNKWSNEVSKGWREGGNSESFRNSIYNKLGLVVGGTVVALPAIQSLPLGSGNIVISEFLKNVGLGGGILALGEAAYREFEPYLRNNPTFKKFRELVARATLKNFDGAQSAKKDFDDFLENRQEQYSQDVVDAFNKGWDENLDRIVSLENKIDSLYNVNPNHVDLPKVRDKLNEENINWQQFYDVRHNRKDLNSVYLDIPTEKRFRELKKSFENDVNIESEKLNKIYSDGMSYNVLGKSLNYVIGAGNLMNTTLNEYFPNSRLEDYVNIALDVPAFNALKGFRAAGAPISAVVASELLPATIQPHIMDGVSALDSKWRKLSPTYDKIVNPYLMHYGMGALFSSPTNKFAYKLINGVSNVPKYINGYMDIKHGGVGVDNYTFNPKSGFKHINTTYPDGHKIASKWWKTPENQKVSATDQNGNWIYFDKQNGVFHESVLNQKTPLIESK